MASYTPAKILGIDDEKGSIEPGKKANLILFDDLMKIYEVWLDGQMI